MVALGAAIVATLSFISENGVEHHVISALWREGTARSVVYQLLTAQGCARGSEGHGSWGKMKSLDARPNRKGHRDGIGGVFYTLYSPDVDEPFAFFLGR